MPIGTGTAIIGAGALGALSGLGGGITSANKANSAAKDAMQMQMDWEFLRARNAHQWEVEDLKKAGLNPILSAGGSGATTGGISAVVPDTSGYAQAGQSIAQGVNTALDAFRLQNETAANAANISNTNADTQNKISQNTLIDAQTISEMARQHLISKQAATEISKQTLNYATAQKVDQETKIQQAKLGLELGALKAQIENAKANKDYTEAKKLEQLYKVKMQKAEWWYDKGERTTKLLFGAANSAANLLDAAIPF